MYVFLFQLCYEGFLSQSLLLIVHFIGDQHIVKRSVGGLFKDKNIYLYICIYTHIYRHTQTERERNGNIAPR